MKIKAYFKDAIIHIHPTSENIIISGSETLDYEHKTFIIIKDELNDKELYNLQINCEYCSALFRDIAILGDNVAIAFENKCYFFNITTKKIFQHKLNSYFDSFFKTESNLFICSSSYINCFDKQGNFKWRSDKLGLNKVKISEVKDDIIRGTGSWDAPEGWKNFEIFLLNGESIDKKQKNKQGKFKGLLKNLKRKNLAG